MSHKIVVIGAGASGLMAASVLAENNHSVTVVEARNRTGGRIHTRFADSATPLEMGAEFIHGDQPLTRALASQANAALSHVSGKWYQFRDGAIQENNMFDEDWDLFNRRLSKQKEDVDIGTFLNTHFREDRYRELRRKITAFVQGYDAADINEVSALSLKEEWAETDEARQYRIVGGYAALIGQLEQNLKKNGGVILTSSPVEEIQWSRGEVKILMRGPRVIEADKAVITIPVGVLQKGSVRFSPTLPEHEKAFRDIGFGGVIKFFLRFDTAFWQRPQHDFRDAAFIISDAEIPTWWTHYPENSPLLTGWFGGPDTFSADHDPEMLFEKAVTSIAYIFRMPAPEVKSRIKEWIIADWAADPFARGAYAFATVETSAARALLTRPVQDTLYFAGEALYSGPAMGTVEAALVSGREVAAQM